ncbi:hypothetical protein ACFVGY_16995 [Streptomyces sp. NPDC127106]|uniref:hypothetical protein n=1 Tax=Streptomyces sp. NPDC127106 TaxID=3345360 RepID=UPI00363F32BD
MRRSVAEWGVGAWSVAVLTTVTGLPWAVLVLAVLLVCLRAGAGASVRFRAGTTAALLSGGVFLAGVPACVVLSDLDHADWREADLPVVWVVASGLSAVLAGLAGLGGWPGAARRVQART